jgi:cation/acetate symporter
VNQLNQITILTGFPLGYYMGSQGSLIVFVIEIFYYAWYMSKLDRKFGLHED